MVQHVLDIGKAVSLAAEKEDHAGVQRSAAGRHDQPIEHTEAEGRFDALTVLQGAQAGTGPEMGDDRPTLRQPRRLPRQAARDSRTAAHPPR